MDQSIFFARRTVELSFFLRGMHGVVIFLHGMDEHFFAGGCISSQ